MAKENEKENKPRKNQRAEVLPTSITAEMEKSYLDYAMSVIVSRALPDIRDGLKPVQRRIIFAMHESGLHPGARFAKCAAVVGETMKKYHPHGDLSIYDALVRMAQPFSLRYPLITSQGNFGSIDGDAPAAMRYTEARLSPIAKELLLDIDKETVEFADNYSGTDKEPTLLPSTIPNLLLNGASGIAVGMATNIPPHNLGEVIDALVFMIDRGQAKFAKEAKEENEETAPQLHFESTATVEDLTQFIKGPDFPTGGIIYDKSEIFASYASGRGSIVMRGKTKIEEIKKGKTAIIVSELPFQVNKALLVARIADLVRGKKIEGISDLRDESDRQGLRVVVELKKEARPQRLLNLLFKYTELQKSFHVNFVALVNKEPRLLTLKVALEEFVRHRQEVILRRIVYLLKKAKEKEHILLGLKIALDHLDAVIETIKRSKDAETAKINLVKKFKLTEIQAQAVLDMQLRRLAALERKKIEEELAETIKAIEEYRQILANPKKVLGLICSELLKTKEKYGDERATKVIQGRVGEFAEEDLIKKEEVLITITESGYIKRLPEATYRIQGRGGKGVIGASLKEGDVIWDIYPGSTHDDLLFFTNKGKVYSLKAWDIPEAGRKAKGTAIVNLLDIEQGEKILTVVPLEKESKAKFLFMTTTGGIVKKTEIGAFENIRRTGIIAIRLKKDDELAWVKPTAGEDEVILIADKGNAIRFLEKDVRPMGRPAAGVRGIRLSKDARVVGMDIISTNQAKGKRSLALLVASENGYGKKTKLSQYRRQNRGGAGILTAKINQRTGKLVASRIVNEEITDVLLTSTEGQVIRLPLKDISTLKRSTQGVRLMRLTKGDTVAALVCL